jgi:PIN domain nuclease of toxin-antitoxin system
MKLLLDTHAWLWSHLEPERLNKRAVAALSAPRAELWLSPITLWETLILIERGRVAVAGTADDWISAALARAPMRDAALVREVALASRAVRVAHQDPADRFLAATAQVYDLVLVTSDANLLAGKGYRTLACG